MSLHLPRVEFLDVSPPVTLLNSQDHHTQGFRSRTAPGTCRSSISQSTWGPAEAASEFGPPAEPRAGTHRLCSLRKRAHTWRLQHTSAGSCPLTLVHSWHLWDLSLTDLPVSELGSPATVLQAWHNGLTWRAEQGAWDVYQGLQQLQRCSQWCIFAPLGSGRLPEQRCNHTIIYLYLEHKGFFVTHIPESCVSLFSPRDLNLEHSKAFPSWYHLFVCFFFFFSPILFLSLSSPTFKKLALPLSWP